MASPASSHRTVESGSGKLLSTEEVAAILRVRPRTAAEWARTGEIPGFKIGRNWLFFEDRILAHLRGEADLQERHR